MRWYNFLILFLLNLAFLIGWWKHYSVETVRVETKYQDREIIKYRNSQQAYMDWADKIKDICNSGSNNGIEKFTIGDDGKPFFSCHH